MNRLQTRVLILVLCVAFGLLKWTFDPLKPDALLSKSVQENHISPSMERGLSGYHRL